MALLDAALSSAGRSAVAQHGALVGLGVLAAAAAAWALERGRRGVLASSDASDGLVSAPGPGGSSWSRSLRRLAPEACALALCLVAAAVLRSRHVQSVPAEDHAIWQQIQSEWPVLVTADSLLGLQAMLKAVLLASAFARVEEVVASPLAGPGTACLLLAAMAQTALLALSPSDVYHLDGPLGGAVNVALETGALAMLAYVAAVQAWRARRRRQCGSVLAVAALLPVLGWLAWNNRLAVASPGESHLDTLFSLQQLLQLAAAVAVAGRTLAAAAKGDRPGPFAVFASVILPVQQLLATYFLLTAWGGAPLEEMPALVGAGQPFKMLQLAGVAQVGLYTASGVAQFVLGGSHEEKQPGPYIDV